MKQGHWCPECAGNIALGIEEAQKIAIKRGGKCISTDYQGVHKLLEWQCAEGHTWFATYSNIAFGRWCPECASGIGERICREYFEQLFGKKFPKVRPSWLINQDGYQMELDGFCKELSLAFEHQGRQHYQQIDYFHSNMEQLEKRQVDDKRKRHLCERHGIKLIEVPQIPDYLPVDKVQQFIIKESRKVGIGIPIDADNVIVNLQNSYKNQTNEKMQKIQDVALSHRGKCLSNKFLGNKIKLKFQCENGHEWETYPYVILHGHWCPKCSITKQGFSKRLTIDQMNQLAKTRGGKCLSQSYINANSHLLWECNRGHQWSAIPNSIKRGSWCPICARESKNRNRYKEVSLP